MSKATFKLENGLYEVDAHRHTEFTAQMSQAHSLKRIADALDALCSSGDRVEMHLSNIADQLMLARQ